MKTNLDLDFSCIENYPKSKDGIKWSFNIPHKFAIL